MKVKATFLFVFFISFSVHSNDFFENRHRLTIDEFQIFTPWLDTPLLLGHPLTEVELDSIMLSNVAIQESLLADEITRRIQLNGDDIEIRIDERSGKMLTLSFSDLRFSTNRGIHIGSSLHDVRSEYGDLLWDPADMFGLNNELWVMAEDPVDGYFSETYSIAFKFSNDAVTRISFWIMSGA